MLDRFSWEQFNNSFYNISSTGDNTIELDFFEALANRINRFSANGQLKSRESYQTTLGHLKTFSKKNTMPLIRLDVEFLKRFDKYLLSSGKSLSTIGIHTRNIRATFNSLPNIASIKAMQPDLYPFGKDKYTSPTTRKAKKALKMSDLQKIYDYNSCVEAEQRAKDLWLFC